MKYVDELDYIYIKEVLLDIQRGHCRLRDRYSNDKQELSKLMEVYGDMLETYASHIYSNDDYVPPLNINYFFTSKGLKLGDYV